MNKIIKKIINSTMLEGKDFSYHNNANAESLQVGFLNLSFCKENSVYKIINHNNGKTYFIGNSEKEAYKTIHELIKGLK